MDWLSSIATPELFWSDLVLGLTGIVCGLWLRRRPAAAAVFILAGVSAILGGSWHGFWGTTASLDGNMVWLGSLLSLAASALLLAYVGIGRRTAAPWLLLMFGLYTAFAGFVSNDLMWTGLLQCVGAVVYAVSLLRLLHTDARPHIHAASGYFVAYVGFTFLSAAATLTQVGPNAPTSIYVIFHALELPAIGLLYMSISEYVS